MLKTSFRIKTLSPIIKLSDKEQELFVRKNNFIYFINRQKLDKILSIMCLLGEFIDYANKYPQNKNITEWLKEHKLFSDEILSEIKNHKILYFEKEERSFIRGFALHEESFSGVFRELLQENINNSIVFEYISINKDRINTYVQNLLKFFEKNNVLSEKENSFQFFINSLFAVDKEKIIQKIQKENQFKIYCKPPELHRDYFCIEKISDNIYCKAIKKDIIADFDIYYPEQEYLEKYIQNEEWENMVRKEQEITFYEQQIDELNEKKIRLKIKPPPKANMSILNLIQILFLCLEEENKKKLNKLLPYKAEDFVFYYKKEENSVSFLNYANIQKNRC